MPAVWLFAGGCFSSQSIDLADFSVIKRQMSNSGYYIGGWEMTWKQLPAVYFPVGVLSHFKTENLIFLELLLLFDCNRRQCLCPPPARK